MPIELKLPDLGENIDAGDVINVLVSEGDEIAPQQGVIEVETGKAVVEVPAPQAGKVVKLHVKKGDKIAVGAPVLSLEPTAVAPQKLPPTAEQPAKPSQPPPARRAPTPSAEDQQHRPAERVPPLPAGAAAHQVPEHGDDGRRDQPKAARRSAAFETQQTLRSTEADVRFAGHATPAAPATRRLARQLGVDLHHVPGSGPGGRITPEDVMAAVREMNERSRVEEPAAPSPPLPDGEPDRDRWGAIRRVPLSSIRKAIAAQMARSAATIPHVTNFDDADITELERIRKASATEYAEAGVKLTSTAFVLKAVALSLRRHPAVNASLDLEADVAIYKHYVNVGVAVDTPRGLIVPVLRDVDRMTIPQIAGELAAAADNARNARFTLDDLRGGTFTVSNLGAIGGTYSTPIINHPEVAILLVGRARKLPVVGADDKLHVRLMCPLSLSYDHRWIDGAIAARFLNEVKEYLETPARLLLAP
jgi:pyruvate dehydrogenase E2 component (dihydrolipoamide acetyltransferase)